MCTTSLISTSARTKDALYREDQSDIVSVPIGGVVEAAWWKMRGGESSEPAACVFDAPFCHHHVSASEANSIYIHVHVQKMRLVV